MEVAGGDDNDDDYDDNDDDDDDGDDDNDDGDIDDDDNDDNDDESRWSGNLVNNHGHGSGMRTPH